MERQEGVADKICWNRLGGCSVNFHQLVMIRENSLENCIGKIGRQIRPCNSEIVQSDCLIIASQRRIGACSDDGRSKLWHGKAQIKDLARSEGKVAHSFLPFQF